MKKLLFVFMAACAMMFTACQSCSEQPEKKDAVVIATDNWQEILETSVIAIQDAYPEYTFYEASGNLKMLADSTWGIDRSTFQIAFGKINDNATVLGHIINDTLKLEQIDSPWLEDVHMSPIVPCDVDDAVKAIQGKVDIKIKGGEPIVLRHQLFPGIYEPEFLLGCWYSDVHGYKIYSGKVDEPINNLDGFYVKHTGLAAEKTEKEAPAEE